MICKQNVNGDNRAAWIVHGTPMQKACRAGLAALSCMKVRGFNVKWRFPQTRKACRLAGLAHSCLAK